MAKNRLFNERDIQRPAERRAVLSFSKLWLRLGYLALVLPIIPGFAFAGDAEQGRQKAVQCQACHGLDGIAKLPGAAHLAGQEEIYLVKALEDFRNGERKNDMMSLVAPNLSDQDIADLAAYYASIPVTVGKPPE
jgi:cytochrome c553